MVQTYHWPIAQAESPERTDVQIDGKVLSRYVGKYVVAGNTTLLLKWKIDALYAQIDDGEEMKLSPKSPMLFALLNYPSDSLPEIFLPSTTSFDSIVWRQNGRETSLIRKDR